MKKIIEKNQFVLGNGPKGIYSDIEISIRKAEKPLLIKNSDINFSDLNVLSKIEDKFKEWINNYEKKGIILEIEILNIGIDKSGRKYKIDNSVNGVMHQALPKIGINPPQMFGL